MPVNSPTNPAPVQPDQHLEDIFAEPGLPLVQTVPYAEPGDTTTEQSQVRRGLSRRTVVLIASGVGCLLLLGGAVFGVIVWLQRAPAHTTIQTNSQTNVQTNLSTPVVNTVVNTNTNTAVTFIDSDHDGLSDQEELLLNTNPKKKDTDADGLSDREEVKVYLTDPRNSDTDADGYTDGEEVAHFYDPKDSNPNKRLFQLP